MMNTPRRPDSPVAFAAKGTGAALGLVAIVIGLLALAPAILMLATDALHNTYEAVPELSFINSVLAIIIARVLVGGGRSKIGGDA